MMDVIMYFVINFGQFYLKLVSLLIFPDEVNVKVW